ncbi:alpha/beta-hydrolase [Colletotrichum zoysiae]|uniref:Alpha/beta-hydrolase n=1 Tax=Colletotrichum zoysiae TaxID=1216348 RepID=A0AAD9M3X2_9PEZI|nr:alpha/beta-hydrolase [Colletotrichum zoysiae]
MPASRRDVEFLTVDKVTLRGWFYGVPESNSPHPCIIMANGLAGLKEQFLPDFAEAFVAAGYTVLLYDHRNWGSSDGLPRMETDPIQQARDFSDAFDFAASLPNVNAKKIVFWGSSMCGGAVLLAAALDKRIAAVISQVLFVSGEGVSQAFAPLLPAIYENRMRLKSGQSPSFVDIFSSSAAGARTHESQVVIHDTNLVPFLERIEEQGLPWDPRVTPQTCLNLIAFEPLAYIHRIAPTPLYMAVADNDLPASTPSQLRAFNAALEPKTISILRNSGHFDAYYGEVFQKNMKGQLEFLQQLFSQWQ